MLRNIVINIFEDYLASMRNSIIVAYGWVGWRGFLIASLRGSIWLHNYICVVEKKKPNKQTKNNNNNKS